MPNRKFLHQVPNLQHLPRRCFPEKMTSINDYIPIMSRVNVAGSNNEEHMSMLVAGLSACLGTQC